MSLAVPRFPVTAMAAAQGHLGPADMLSDPLFKQGFAHVWEHQHPTKDLGWMPHEQQAYERGRHFACWCQAEGEGRIALTRGFLPHPRAEALLARAIHMGEV